jgi:uncharacterized protein YegJ (DUF2314 family)
MAVYSPRTFTKYVLARPGDARKLILVEPLATADGGDLAALGTVGLRARGIPELIVQGVPSGEFETVATLLNATAQTLLENPTVVDGTIAVDFGVLGESWDAASIRANGGTARIMWRAQWTDERDPDLRPEMDPSGPQITLSVAGASTQSAEALMIAVNQFVGAPDDNPVRRGDDAELEAAAKRARTELAALIPVFSKGPRATGERLSVKCGFIEGEVTEWMWVDVIKLTKTHVDGTLDNRPSVVKLTEGARVQVPYELVADYIHTKADGSKVGGYSVEINQRRGR